MSSGKNQIGTVPTSMEHTIIVEALAFRHIFCKISRLSSLSHSFSFLSIHINYLPLHHLISLVNVKPNFYVALPDCTEFDSAWLVKYLVCQASHESWFCLCSNQWCISARKVKKKKKTFDI